MDDLAGDPGAILAQVVGMILSCLTQAIVTAGLATPWLIAQVSTRVSALSARCPTPLLYMTRSFELVQDEMTRALFESRGVLTPAE